MSAQMRGLASSRRGLQYAEAKRSFFLDAQTGYKWRRVLTGWKTLIIDTTEHRCQEDPRQIVSAVEELKSSILQSITELSKVDENLET
jgi:hypothetical protein